MMTEKLEPQAASMPDAEPAGEISELVKKMRDNWNQASIGVCSISPKLFAQAIDALTSLSAQLAEQEGYPGIAHDFGLVKIALEHKVALLAQADARIASLEADLAAMRAERDAFSEELGVRLAERDAALVDAERYRWLRDDDNWCDDEGEWTTSWLLLGEKTMGEFDAAIDAARKGKEGG